MVTLLCRLFWASVISPFTSSSSSSSLVQWFREVRSKELCDHSATQCRMHAKRSPHPPPQIPHDMNYQFSHFLRLNPVNRDNGWSIENSHSKSATDHGRKDLPSVYTRNPVTTYSSLSLPQAAQFCGFSSIPRVKSVILRL